MSVPIHRLTTWQRPVFLLNSRHPLFTAATSGSRRRPFTLMWRSFSRSYGAILPSSLAGVISSASGYSPCPRVSVCGTVTTALKHLEVFLGSVESMTTLTRRITRSSPQLSDGIFLATSTPKARNRAPEGTISLIIYPSTSLHRSNHGGAGI